MGYTPLFDTLTKGTLCGRWPDIGLWPIVLSLSDRNGVVDVTPIYIAGITGLKVEEVVACMKRFCEPDPFSRSSEENGARLVLIDSHREWGWHIVNHTKYREKARKAASEVERIASGENLKRMKTRRDPRRPAKTRDDRLSDSDSDSDKKEERDVASATAQVFQHWKQTHGHPSAKLDVKREKTILDALKTYSAEDLCLAISGYKNSKWHMGENDRKTVFDGLHLLLRDAEHIDQGIKLAANGSAQTWQ